MPMPCHAMPVAASFRLISLACCHASISRLWRSPYLTFMLMLILFSFGGFRELIVIVSSPRLRLRLHYVFAAWADCCHTHITTRLAAVAAVSSILRQQ